MIFRIFSVLDFDSRPGTLGGIIKQAIYEKRQISIKNALDKRDFLTPKTIAQTIEKCISKDIDGGIYNICSGETRSVKQAAQAMLRKAKLPETWFEFSMETSEVPVLFGDNSNLRKAVPGIQKTLTWEPSEFQHY